MLVDSQQGTQLSPRQRLMLQQQQHVRSFMHPVLLDQVAETLKAMEVRKEQGASKWVDPNKFNIVDFKSRGTPSVAEWMGY